MNLRQEAREWSTYENLDSDAFFIFEGLKSGHMLSLGYWKSELSFW